MHAVLERVYAKRIVVIVRGIAPRRLEGLAHALVEGGIGMMEVTFDASRPDAYQETLDGISMLATRFSTQILPGAGTVLTPEQVQRAADAGAQYIISPDMNPAVIEKTKALGLASMPGAMTPTEIITAHDVGADAVKVFPAGVLGPEYIKSVKAPLSHVPLMAVGGVNEKNAAAYLAAGAIGLGIGGNIVNKEWIEAEAWAKITALAKLYVEAIASVHG